MRENQRNLVEVEVPRCIEQQGQLDITHIQPEFQATTCEGINRALRKKDHETSRSSLGPGALNTVSCLVPLAGDEAKCCKQFDHFGTHLTCYMGN